MAVVNITNNCKHELLGLSTDLATLGVYTAGSTFYATDTKLAYISDGAIWVEV